MVDIKNTIKEIMLKYKYNPNEPEDSFDLMFAEIFNKCNIFSNSVEINGIINEIISEW